MSKKRIEQRMEYYHNHLIQAVDTLVMISNETKNSSYTNEQKLNAIKKIIQSYLKSNKGKIEF